MEEVVVIKWRLRFRGYRGIPMEHIRSFCRYCRSDIFAVGASLLVIFILGGLVTAAAFGLLQDQIVVHADEP